MFALKFGGKDGQDSSFKEDILKSLCGGGQACDKEAKALLRGLIDNQSKKIAQQKVSSMSAALVAADLNSRVAKMNLTLQQYHQQKKELEAKWKEQDDAVPEGRKRSRRYRDRDVPRKKKARKKKLGNLKKDIFHEFTNQYAQLHASGAGQLFQTEAVKKAAGLSDLQEIRVKFFGGIEEVALKDTESFALLDFIDETTARQAMSEALSRTPHQVQDLLQRRKNKDSMENLTHLVTVNPTSAGRVLLNNPLYGELFCDIAKKMAVGERNRKVGQYMIVGVGTAAALVATAGAALPVAVTAGALATGAAYTATQVIYHNREESRNEKLLADMLNSYFSGTGNDQSIGEMRTTWQNMKQADHKARFFFGIWHFRLACSRPCGEVGDCGLSGPASGPSQHCCQREEKAFSPNQHQKRVYRGR